MASSQLRLANDPIIIAELAKYTKGRKRAFAIAALTGVASKHAQLAKHYGSTSSKQTLLPEALLILETTPSAQRLPPRSGQSSTIAELEAANQHNTKLSTDLDAANQRNTKLAADLDAANQRNLELTSTETPSLPRPRPHRIVTPTPAPPPQTPSHTRLSTLVATPESFSPASTESVTTRANRNEKLRARAKAIANLPAPQHKRVLAPPTPASKHMQDLDAKRRTTATRIANFVRIYENTSDSDLPGTLSRQQLRELNGHIESLNGTLITDDTVKRAQHALLAATGAVSAAAAPSVEPYAGSIQTAKQHLGSMLKDSQLATWVYPKADDNASAVNARFGIEFRIPIATTVSLADVATLLFSDSDTLNISLIATGPVKLYTFHTYHIVHAANSKSINSDFVSKAGQENMHLRITVGGLAVSMLSAADRAALTTEDALSPAGALATYRVRDDPSQGHAILLGWSPSLHYDIVIYPAWPVVQGNRVAPSVDNVLPYPELVRDLERWKIPATRRAQRAALAHPLLNPSIDVEDRSMQLMFPTSSFGKDYFSNLATASVPRLVMAGNFASRVNLFATEMADAYYMLASVGKSLSTVNTPLSAISFRTLYVFRANGDPEETRTFVFTPELLGMTSLSGVSGPTTVANKDHTTVIEFTKDLSFLIAEVIISNNVPFIKNKGSSTKDTPATETMYKTTYDALDSGIFSHLAASSPPKDSWTWAESSLHMTKLDSVDDITDNTHMYTSTSDKSKVASNATDSINAILARWSSITRDSVDVFQLQTRITATKQLNPTAKPSFPIMLAAPSSNVKIDQFDELEKQLFASGGATTAALQPVALRASKRVSFKPTDDFYENADTSVLKIATIASSYRSATP